MTDVVGVDHGGWADDKVRLPHHQVFFGNLNTQHLYSINI